MGSQSDINQAENETIKLVEYDHKVKSVNDFYWTTIGKTYFSLDFIDEDNNQRYAIVSQDGGDTKYYTPKDIISKEDAMSITVNNVKPYKIMQSRLGIHENQPVWEMTLLNENDTISYYYLNATNGEWIQTIENI